MTLIEPLPVVDTATHGVHRRPARRWWRRWTWSHRLVAGAFLLWFAAAPYFVPPSVFAGNWTAARWFDRISIVDPLAFAETVVASRHVTRQLVIGVVPTVAMAVLLGRLFCGWICPLGLVLEMAAAATRRLHPRRQAASPRASGRSPSHRWKYAVLAGCLAASALAATPFFTSLSPINLPFIWRADHAGLAALLLVGLIVLEWRYERIFCRSLCPLGALYSLLGRSAWLCVRIEGEERFRCRQCTRDCPMGIDVMTDHVLAGHDRVVDPECTRCGSCTDRCYGDLLRIGWRRRRSPSVEAGDQTPAAT